jgi:hypothetical protein
VFGRTLLDSFRNGSQSRIEKTANLELIFGEASFSGSTTLADPGRQGQPETVGCSLNPFPGFPACSNRSLPISPRNDRQRHLARVVRDGEVLAAIDAQAIDGGKGAADGASRQDGARTHRGCKAIDQLDVQRSVQACAIGYCQLIEQQKILLDG